MKKKTETKKLTKTQELIKRRRAQMLIHSCLYYEMNTNIVSDDMWQKWADELEQLQKKHSKDCNIDFFDYDFRDWDGSTGSHLPHREPWVYFKANQILRIHEKMSTM
jgi:hypothetical protein